MAEELLADVVEETFGDDEKTISNGPEKFENTDLDDGEAGNIQDLKGEQPEITDQIKSNDIREGEHVEGNHIDGEIVEDEQTEGEQIEVKEKVQDEAGEVIGEGEEIIGEGEEITGEELEGEHITEEAGEKKIDEPIDEFIEEEEVYVEEPPPDPAAPYNFSDSQERLKEPFELRSDQMAEVEQLWEIYQNYTPAYTDLDGYITEKELLYMLKSLILMTYTPEQLQELITFCVRPPHSMGHITYEQFLKMVTIRQRDLPIEEELRAALQILDPGKTGAIDREYFREVLGKMGHKMPPKQLEYLIKEVDISNDGTIGIDDVVGTMCIDLNKDDIIMLREAVYPSEKQNSEEQGDGNDN